MLQMKKGDKLKMQKADGSAINHIRLELGWAANAFGGAKFDLDASCIALVDNQDPAYPFGKGYSEDFVLFYNSVHRTTDDKTSFEDHGLPKKGKPTVPGCAMIHSGDNRTGDGDGADEVINIDVSKLPPEVNVMHVLVTIDEAEARGQTFGQVRNSWVKTYDAETNECLASYDLEESGNGETALLFVEIRKKNGVWSVNAVNQGYAQGLAKFFEVYGFQTS